MQSLAKDGFALESHMHVSARENSVLFPERDIVGRISGYKLDPCRASLSNIPATFGWHRDDE